MSRRGAARVDEVCDVAWKIAAQLGWDDTFTAEYIALTRLQADAFVTLDQQLARAVAKVTATAPVAALTSSGGAEEA